MVGVVDDLEILEVVVEDRSGTAPQGERRERVRVAAELRIYRGLRR